MTILKVVCPKCGGLKHDIIIELRDGHRIPIGFRCLEEGCGWQGESRKIIWDDGSNETIHTDTTQKTIDEMSRDADVRDEYHRTKFKDPSINKRRKRSSTPRVAKSTEPGVNDVPVVTLPKIKLPSKHLIDSTPITCDVCGQPVVDLWVNISGELQNIADKGNLPTYYLPLSGFTINCSVCGEQLDKHIMHEVIVLVDVLTILLKPPTECSSCHVSPDKYPITGNLTFSWTNTNWVCSGEVRLSCPGCSSVLSIYKQP
jgi:hypothetical protein